MRQQQRCDGPSRLQAVLLPSHDHDPYRPHREASEVCAPRIFATALSKLLTFVVFQVHTRRAQLQEDEHAAVELSNMHSRAFRIPGLVRRRNGAWLSLRGL
jgi:hypothetical protein